MKKGFLFSFLLSFFLPSIALATDFTACESTYALCTTAKCAFIPGKKDAVSCQCDVKTGYSAGTKPCEKIKETSKGQLIYSRYYPIKSYVVCSNNRPWAWCLDSPCVINKKDPSKASCLCSIAKNQGDYIIVTDKYHQSTCTTDVYSSATVSAATEITEFLKTQSNLSPFPITVIKGEK